MAPTTTQSNWESEKPTTVTERSTDHRDIIHIVGLYKCGTTWLLRALAAHPQVVAWREFDPIRAAFAPLRTPSALLSTVADYLHKRPENPHWMARREAVRARERDDIFREMFLGRGWIPLMGAAKQREAAELDRSDMNQLLSALLERGEFNTRPEGAPPLAATACNQPLGVAGFSRASLASLMDAVATCSDATQVPRLFYDSLREQVQPESRVACKAADQLMTLSQLRQVSAGSRCVAIIRDGRDAAVSAKHFEQLMRKQQAPWRVGSASALRRMLGWSVRAAKLAEHARRGDILVIRYEDLHRDFAGTLGALLGELELRADDSLLAKIHEKTQFSAASGGRRPGESAEHILRKGVVGDWKQALSRAESALAWRIASEQLSAFGYARDGELHQSELVLSAP